MLGVCDERKESEILGAQINDFHNKMMKIALEIVFSFEIMIISP